MEAMRNGDIFFEPDAAARFQECVRAEHIGIDEGVGSGDRAVDMRFSGEMHDRVERVTDEFILDELLITNVGVHKDEALVGFDSL